jgi:hypothetical protein
VKLPKIVLVCLLMTSLLCPASRAGNQETGSTENWYRWSIRGKAAGYFHQKKEVRGAGDGQVQITSEFVVVFRGQRMELRMVTTCRNDDTLTPLTIESKGEGNDEFATFTAHIDWSKETGKLSAKVQGHGTVEKDLPVRTTTAFALFAIAPRLPFDQENVFRFHSLEASELNLKKNHQLKYLGKETVAIDGKQRKLHKFEQSGDGIQPCLYWVDDEHRLVRVLMDNRKEFLRTDEKTARGAVGG